MVYYISTFCRDNIYRDTAGGKYRFVNVSAWTGDVLNAVVHPDDAYAAYTDMLTPLKNLANMQMLFTDFLCWRGPELQRHLPTYFEADHTWLDGMTRAAQDLGIEVQYCMACGHQAMDSLRWPAVTNMRASGDGGLNVPAFAYASLLQGALGLGFSKDNLRLSNCSVPPCHGAYSPYGAALQTVLAALSLGPVGLADQLTSRLPPALEGEGLRVPLAGDIDTGIDVNTNVTLALSTTSSNGWLLQPSFPLTPIDPCLVAQEGLSPSTGNVWATYTAVGSSVWWTAVGWGWDTSADARSNYTLLPAHLSPMIDSSAVDGDFSAVPRGGFVGSGTTLDDLGEYVWWDPAAEQDPARPFNTDGAMLRLATHLPHQLNIAPVIGGVALLGEKGKAAAMSTYRFVSVLTSVNATGLQVTLRGAAGENVTLIYATAALGLKIERKLATVGAGGEVSLNLP
jgi:hypothetical protein